MTEEKEWYFTAPWNPVSIRRGDALGLRAGADYFADLLAPGLSNATSDARWISLLSWCLQWSHVTWEKAGGGDLSRRDAQMARYAWLRPLELLWVARTLKFNPNATGQLRGRKSIDRWDDEKNEPLNFAMSPDQFRRYRQVGMYGAYRVIFRTVGGLTTGDGWTPDATALKLAKLVNDNLSREVRLNEEHFERRTIWDNWSGGKEAEYWLKIGWENSLTEGGRFLPTPDNQVSKLLPKEERRLLKPVLFGDDSIRRITAETLANAKGAKSHADLCDALANSSLLAKKLAPHALESLPAFSRFADAAMHAMRGLWNEMNQDGEQQSPTITKLAQSTELQSRLEGARAKGEAWLAPGRNYFNHGSVITHLAKALTKEKNPADQIRALAQHHHEYGGGRRWFREQAGKMEPLVADKGLAASDYRFRLRSLCCLAAQCGVAKMNVALDAIEHNEIEDAASHEPDGQEDIDQ